MPAVNVLDPVPPPWYVESSDLAAAVDLVRNGNAVFWRVYRTHPDRVDPLEPVTGPPVKVADYGLFCPGSGYTPPGSVLFVPPPGRAGLTLPGLAQHDPAAPGYPVVRTGAVTVNLAASGISFRLS